jgi:hypothetical protein
MAEKKEKVLGNFRLQRPESLESQENAARPGGQAAKGEGDRISSGNVPA